MIAPLPQQSQMEQREWEVAKLNRKRYLDMAFAITGVPYEPNMAAPQNEPSQPSCSETQPVFDSQSRPESPKRSNGNSISESNLTLTSHIAEDAGPSFPQDPTRQSISIFSPVAEKWITFIAKLDTGVDGNWIAEDSLQDLNIEAQPNSAPLLTFETFDGKTLQSRKQVEVRWGFSNSGRTHRTLFRVAEEGAPFDVVIGRDFLLVEDIVTFKTNKSVLLFVQTARTKAEKKAIADEEARVELENKALAQKKVQEKALRKYLSERKGSKKKNQESNSGRTTNSEGSSRRRMI